MELDDYNGNGYYDIKDFIDAPEKEILKFNDNMKFDVILMNPPYDNGLGDLFLSKVLTLSDIVLTVQPSTWIFSKNNKRNCIKDIYNICKDRYVDIMPIYGKDFFDAQIQGSMAITLIDANKKPEILYNGYSFSSFDEIYHYSDDKYIVSIKPYIDKLVIKDNLKNHLKYIKGLTAHVLNKSFHEDKNPDDNNTDYIDRLCIDGKAL